MSLSEALLRLFDTRTQVEKHTAAISYMFVFTLDTTPLNISSQGTVISMQFYTETYRNLNQDVLSSVKSI